MTLALAKISAQRARTEISHEFGGVFGDISLRRSLAADHIRSALYANAVLATAHDLSPAVHTSRLLTSVRKTLDLLWPGTATEHLHDTRTINNAVQATLYCLRDFGDTVDTGGGYWIGTPLRVLRCGDAVLVIGAAPNAAVRALLGAPPVCAGISRFGQIRSKEVAEFAISVSQWLGDVEDISSWTRRILDQHEQRMQSGNDIPADQLEIYAPDCLTNGQRNPWLAAQAIGHPLKGARLCRPIKTFTYEWDRPFYLSHFHSSGGDLVMTRSSRVDYSLTRRLRFGLSQLYDTPQVAIATTNGDLIELDMPFALPDPEARIAALGWPLPSNPRRTVFHRYVTPFLTEVMKRLAVPVLVK